jgi:hypothetical protein
MYCFRCVESCALDNYKENMTNKIYKLIPDDKHDLESDSAYFYSREIAYKVLAHHKRSIVKIVNPQTNKSIIRKVRTKAIPGLNSNSILLDYLGTKELHANQGDDIIVQRPSFFDKYFRYYKNHPNEDLRLAFTLFWIGLVFSKIIDIIFS